MATIVFTREEAFLIQQGYTEAQIIMRRELSRDGDKASKPKSVLQVFDELMGEQGSDKDVAEEAYELINQMADGLHLKIKEWAIVQKLVEAGIKAGRGVSAPPVCTMDGHAGCEWAGQIVLHHSSSVAR